MRVAGMCDARIEEREALITLVIFTLVPDPL